MKLEKIFESIGKKLVIDFDNISSEINHRFSKGHVRELELASQFVRKYIPAKIGVGNGEIVATSDEVSNECDLILYEKNSCPFLLYKEGYQIFPIELVHGIIEVKSNLDSRELEDAFNKIQKIKKFPKSAFRPQEGPIIKANNLYDKEWDFFPTLGFVFAYNSIDLLTLKDKLKELHKDVPLEHRIDSVWVLKKGILMNWSDEEKTLDSIPSKKSRIRAIQSDNILMTFTIQLQRLLLSSWVRQFRISDYLAYVNHGKFIDE